MKLYHYLTITLIFLPGCLNLPQPEKLPLPLPQSPNVQVYFNHNQSQGAKYTEPYRNLEREGDDLEEIIVTAINSANYTIDVAVQEFRLPKIAQALAKKHRAGVKVRVILENSYSRPYSIFKEREIDKLEQTKRRRYHEFIALVDTNQDGNLSTDEINQGDALVILRNAGIPIIDDTADGSKDSDLMHHKFVIIDEEILLTGSVNFTTSGIHGDFKSPESRGNANNLVQIKSRSLAKLFGSEFNFMWGDGPGGKLDSKFGKNKPWRQPQQVIIGDSKITVNFAPTSPKTDWEFTGNGVIGSILKEADKSVNMALFVFSDQKLGDILQTLHHRGVKVRALIDKSFAYRYYSEGLDMLGVALRNKCKYEADNHPWEVPINTVGVSRLPKGDKLHHKFAVIDDKIVITGSHNWSASANYNNDEALLVIENPTVAAHFSREFARLYSKAVLGVPIAVQNKMSKQEKECF